MKTRIKIIHHNDLDGYIAGTIIKIKYPKAKCYCVNYDNIETFPKKNEFNKNDAVFMVDYCATPEMMNWFKNNVDFYWIDHHKSAIENSNIYDWNNIKGIRKIGLCGAELAWKFIYPKNSIPKFIQFVGNYDTFRFADKPIHEKMILPFSFGSIAYMERMKPENYENEDFLFKTENDFYKEWLSRFIEEGKIIYNYKKAQGEMENPLNSFVRNIWGYRVLCMNSCCRGSDQFTIPKTWNPEYHDMMLIYYYNGNNWCYGFYTEKKDVDVSKIALKYGGGGHAGAAGATTKELIKELL